MRFYNKARKAGRLASWPPESYYVQDPVLGSFITKDVIDGMCHKKKKIKYYYSSKDNEHREFFMKEVAYGLFF